MVNDGRTKGGKRMSYIIQQNRTVIARTKASFWSWYLGKIKQTVRWLKIHPRVATFIFVGILFALVALPFCLILLLAIITALAYRKWAYRETLRLEVNKGR